MPRATQSESRSRFAVLGVLAFGPSTGYEIRKLLSETTAHFWKESYGQIYPTLEELSREGLIEMVSDGAAGHAAGRPTKRYRILAPGEKALRGWIRSSELQLRPGRNELLLKLFFARRQDIDALIPQIEAYGALLKSMRAAYTGFAEEDLSSEIPPDARVLIGTTIDYGIAATQMQLDWCSRTTELLVTLSAESSSTAQRDTRRDR